MFPPLFSRNHRCQPSNTSTLTIHLLHAPADFFISAINQKTHVIFGVVFLMYLFLSFFWSIPYYLIMRYEPGCIYGATHYVEIWIYAFITMTTIGEPGAPSLPCRAWGVLYEPRAPPAAARLPGAGFRVCMALAGGGAVTQTLLPALAPTPPTHPHMCPPAPGYGNTGPQACWSTSAVISVQSIFSLLLEAVVIGIIFARISHPKQRGRSIFISDSAVVSRRDGILKFMFRVADVRKTQVVDPKIKAYLYTWGDGRITAEGERVPGGAHGKAGVLFVGGRALQNVKVFQMGQRPVSSLADGWCSLEASVRACRWPGGQAHPVLPRPDTWVTRLWDASASRHPLREERSPEATPPPPHSRDSQCDARRWTLGTSTAC